jgi:hypothetical protein
VASKRLVVVEVKDVGTAEEFLQSHDVDMPRVVLVITGVVRSETEREKRAYWLRAARGEPHPHQYKGSAEPDCTPRSLDWDTPHKDDH